MNKFKIKDIKIIDGDTVRCSICLPFDVIVANQTIRIDGIDTPESKSSDPVEKYYGLLSKTRLYELINEKTILVTDCKKGKFGRYLGDFIVDDKKVSEILLDEFLAVRYSGESKSLIKERHLENRRKLMQRNIFE